MSGPKEEGGFRREPVSAQAGMPDLWFGESFQGVVSFELRVKEVLYQGKSQYQDIAILDTYQHGRLLALDGLIMLTELDESIYHEMIAHVPMQTLSHARRAAVIGGGDGGTLRELARYPELEEIVLAEIDEQVVNACREFLPGVSSGFSDPRVKFEFADGAEFIKQVKPESLDLIIVDGTDPVGPGAVLVGEEFYKDAALALHEGGVLSAQTESPLYHGSVVRDIFSRVGRAFANTFMFWAVIPSYPGSMWSFCYASPCRHPLNDLKSRRPDKEDFSYYTPELHKAAFALPGQALDCLAPGHPQKEKGRP